MPPYYDGKKPRIPAHQKGKPELKIL